MKTFLFLSVLLAALDCFASQDSTYEWSEIKYQTFIEEVGKLALLTVRLKPDSIKQHNVFDSLALELGGVNLRVPLNVLSKYDNIHPMSFGLEGSVVGESGEESGEVFLFAVCFNYGFSPKARRGCISFQNGDYWMHEIHEP